MAVSSRTKLIFQLASDNESVHSSNCFNETFAKSVKRKLNFDRWLDPDQMENVQTRKQHRGEFNIDNLDRLSREELVEKIKVLYSHNVQLKNIIAKSGGGKKKKKSQLKHQRQFDFENCTTRHVLLKFYYAGWDYCGFATQEDTINTIEHYLFEGLVKTCLIKDRTTSNYHRCGRTDKGVSSFGQVISIDLRSKLEKDDPNLENEINYCWILNKVLPDAIQCVAWCPVDDEFSSRFNCNGRTYKYFFPKANLNIENMNTAAQFMLGTHDFRNFCKMDVGNGVIKFFRTINSIEILPSSLESKNADEFSMYVLTIQGQAFLWHQIRYLMGVLILVGDGREKPSIVQDLLNVELNPRKPDYNMASEVPLNLYYCDYDDVNDTDWMYNQTAMSIVLSKLQSMWTFSSVKSTMLENMLRDLYKVCEKHNIATRTEYNNCLLSGVRSKSYIPLMERQKCESLESKIEHFVKRQRLEVLDETILENST